MHLYKVSLFGVCTKKSTQAEFQIYFTEISTIEKLFAFLDFLFVFLYFFLRSHPQYPFLISFDFTHYPQSFYFEEIHLKVGVLLKLHRHTQ